MTLESKINIAFIPARSGSKRLPGKNIKLFAGQPLINFSIAFAQYHSIEKIVVSTDSDEIAEIAYKKGAEVLLRPLEISGDNASTSDAAKHCIDHYSNKGISFNSFITLQPTNPLRPQNLLKDGYKSFNEKECDSVISVNLNKHKIGKINNGFYKTESYKTETRSQDLEPLFFENGLIYITRPENVIAGDLFGKKIHTVETEELFGITDIDTLLDFEVCEFLYKKYFNLFKYLEI